MAQTTIVKYRDRKSGKEYETTEKGWDLLLSGGPTRAQQYVFVSKSKKKIADVPTSKAAVRKDPVDNTSSDKEGKEPESKTSN